jgi:hypothetical protein
MHIWQSEDAGWAYTLTDFKRRPTCTGKLRRETGRRMTMLLILLLVVLLLALAPRWPYSRNWGYYPSGGLGVVLAIVIVLMLLGQLRL